MADVFRTSVRRVGTSLGVLIPKDVARKQRLHEGEEIEIGILKKQKRELIEQSFGIAKGASPFQRDKRDRDF